MKSIRNYLPESFIKIFQQLNLGMFPRDIEEDKNFKTIYKICKPYTMTSIERMFSLYDSVRYVNKYKIPGDIVECGVWKGGSSMVCALSLLKLNDLSRKIFLYDTYSGMTEPTQKDINLSDQPAIDKYKKLLKDTHNEWCFVSLDDVKKNLLITGYPEKNFIFIQGNVKDTIPKMLPEKIAILRLDTDWYDSTYHELVHLYPRLSNGGILLLDDYGHWKGAKEATDKYFSESNQKIFLSRIDYTGRIGLKQ